MDTDVYAVKAASTYTKGHSGMVPAQGCSVHRGPNVTSKNQSAGVSDTLPMDVDFKDDPNTHPQGEGGLDLGDDDDGEPDDVDDFAFERNHYEILKVKAKASSFKIKRAYRALSRIHHPDKGGEAIQFRRIKMRSRFLATQASGRTTI